MEATSGFDVLAVATRAVALDIEVASHDELRWADRAADRLRAWVDAWQAQVEFRLTLPPPLPPPPDWLPEDHPQTDRDTDDPATDDAEPLPSLGEQPVAVESPQEMLRKARRMRLLAELPSFADALLALRITTAHVDLLAAALDALPEPIRLRVLARGDELLRNACACSADWFRRAIHRIVSTAYDDEGVDRAVRQRAQSGLRSGVDAASGMHWVHVTVDPERGAALLERLRNEREAIFHSGGHTGLNSEQVDLQALLNLLSQPGSDQKSSPNRTHLSVIVDIETLALSAHDRTVCETWSGAAFPPDTARGLICAAEMTFGFAIQGRVVHHVANARLATRDQQRELRMQHRTCGGPACTRSFDHCQVHHIIPRSRGGPTSVPLMIPLCQRCHDLIHHRGWTLSIDPDRTMTWTAPNGDQTVIPFAGLADADQPSLFEPDPPAA